MTSKLQIDLGAGMQAPTHSSLSNICRWALPSSERFWGQGLFEGGFSDWMSCPIFTPTKAESPRASLLEMFERFAELSQPRAGYWDYFGTPAAAQERANLLRDIPQMIRRESAFAEVAGMELAATRPVVVSKRYALLSGATYYPYPGWQGFSGWFDDIEAATAAGQKAAEEAYGWFQVLDTTTFKIVAGEGTGHSGLFGMVDAGPAENSKA
jgi:hypothetical protein